MEVMATWCTEERVAGYVKTLLTFQSLSLLVFLGHCWKQHSASAWPLLAYSVAMANTMPQSNLGVKGFIWLICPCQKPTIEGSEDRD